MAHSAAVWLIAPIPEFGWQMHILKPLTPVMDAQWIAAFMAGGLYGVIALAEAWLATPETTPGT